MLYIPHPLVLFYITNLLKVLGDNNSSSLLIKTFFFSIVTVNIKIRTNHSQLKRQHKTDLATTTSQWCVSYVSSKVDGNTPYVSFVFIFLKCLCLCW